MDLLTALNRIIDDHDDASRALRNRFLDNEADAEARYRAMIAGDHR